MMELKTKIGIRADRIVHEQPANPFGYGVGHTSFGGGAGGAGFHPGPSSFGGAGFLAGLSSFGGGSGNTTAGGGGFFAGLGGGGGTSFGGGGGFFDGFGAGSGSFGAGGGGSDNNGIVPFYGRVPDAGGSKAPSGFNHGYGRGFY
ncbi:hypothetical protein ACSBR1_019544 [Camellia fascicularis]